MAKHLEKDIKTGQTTDFKPDFHGELKIILAMFLIFSILPIVACAIVAPGRIVEGIAGFLGFILPLLLVLTISALYPNPHIRVSPNYFEFRRLPFLEWNRIAIADIKKMSIEEIKRGSSTKDWVRGLGPRYPPGYKIKILLGNGSISIGTRRYCICNSVKIVKFLRDHQGLKDKFGFKGNPRYLEIK